MRYYMLCHRYCYEIEHTASSWIGDKKYIEL